VGHDKTPRYLIVHRGRSFWRPNCKRMIADGFRRVPLGPAVLVDGKLVPSPADVARATELNQQWDRHRHGLGAIGPRLRYRHGSIAEGYHRAMAMRQKQREANGIVWTREHHSRDDWPRAWKHLEPLIGDFDPKHVTPEMLLKIRTGIAAEVSES